MKAAFLYNANDLRLEETEKPSINDDEILVKVKSAAICGTDIRMFKNGYAGVDQNNPRILGHEISGEIAETGKNVQKYKKGMRVAIAPNMGCGTCDRCVSGNTHLCETYEAFGINLQGGFAEYLKIPAKAVNQGNLVELDDKISYEEAALVEPLSCVFNGQSRVNIELGDTVLIIGAGPIGIMHAFLAKIQGAVKVFMNDLSEDRLALCKELDPDIITVTSAELKEKIMAETKGNGVDVSIIAAPSPEAQSSAIELMNMNGRVLFFGGLPKDRENVQLNSNTIHYKQLAVHGSARASLIQYRKSLALVENGLIPMKKIISSRFKLDEINEAVKKAADGSGLKNVINFED